MRYDDKAASAYMLFYEDFGIFTKRLYSLEGDVLEKSAGWETTLQSLARLH